MDKLTVVNLDEQGEINGRRVVLVNMPFAAIDAPSIGLGILKAKLLEQGALVTVLDLNLDFAALIGTQNYDRIVNEAGIGVFAGEWLFSSALFERPANLQAFCHNILDAKHPDQPCAQNDSVVESIIFAAQRVEPFLQSAVTFVCSLRPEVVGFTSMFQQHVPSLALAKRLKHEISPVPIIMGGPNCDGVMGAETARCFPFIDAIVNGEAEQTIGPVVAALLANKPLEAIPGVITPSLAQQDFERAKNTRTTRMEDMDSVPLPDYEDYFISAQAHRDILPTVSVSFESSRGCWWGEKSHCVFCGINGDTMPYRAKSAARVMHELHFFRDKYPNAKLVSVDNIMAFEHMKDLLPTLAEEKIKFDLFYEVKSNLRDDQVKLLGKAGVRHIQPGVESLHSDILQLMAKGVTGIQNIQLLKSCETHGVGLYWNFIWGFPGEPQSAYEQMEAMLPMLYHLPAPGMSSRILMNRFAPHFEKSQDFGFKAVRPFPAYQEVYPLPKEQVHNLAYYFRFDYDEGLAPQMDERAFNTHVAKWREQVEPAFLFHGVNQQGCHVVVDSRSGKAVTQYALSAAEGVVIRACETRCSKREVHTKLSGALKRHVSEQEFSQLIAALQNKKLLITENKQLLSLAIDIELYNLAKQSNNSQHRQQVYQMAVSYLSQPELVV